MAKNLYVGNLSFQTTEDDLRQAFGQYGTVVSAQVVNDRETGRSRGFAFVEMDDGADEGAVPGPRLDRQRSQAPRGRRGRRWWSGGLRRRWRWARRLRRWGWRTGRAILAPRGRKRKGPPEAEGLFVSGAGTAVALHPDRKRVSFLSPGAGRVRRRHPPPAQVQLMSARRAPRPKTRPKAVQPVIGPMFQKPLTQWYAEWKARKRPAPAPAAPQTA